MSRFSGAKTVITGGASELTIVAPVANAQMLANANGS
jgi:hypothetical protein